MAERKSHNTYSSAFYVQKYGQTLMLSPGSVFFSNLESVALKSFVDPI